MSDILSGKKLGHEYVTADEDSIAAQMVNEFEAQVTRMYKDKKMLRQVHTKMHGCVKATFTDAVLVDNQIYFLAAAEKSESTYLDGEVTGTIIGKLSPETLEVEYTEKISDTQKFEGITLYQKNSNSLEFLLCEDKDSEDLKSTIYKLTIKKTTR